VWVCGVVYVQGQTYKTCQTESEAFSDSTTLITDRQQCLSESLYKNNKLSYFAYDNKN
jgi:hypothetical protein